MYKLKTFVISGLGIAVATCATIIPTTACSSVYLILRDNDFSKGDLDGTKVPTNSRIIDATNTLLYMTDYDFEYNLSDVPSSITSPQRIKLQGSSYFSHLVLFAGEVAYTIKVIAAMNYHGNIYKESITVNIKTTA
ncbi:MAG: hypothetical protein LBD63_02570 [Mycoplasmataceae bacterium]|jgi:hypothetical protein|nr:hypothetical protein [Mycoplasmataceae bacterium]